MFVRVQSTNTPGKAKRLRKELERSGSVTGSITIARLGEDRYSVITEMRLEDILPALYAAAKGTVNAQEQEHLKDSEVTFTDKPPRGGLPPDASKNYGRKRTPEIKRSTDGELQAPAGEAFIFCAECGSAKWFVTESTDGGLARMACTSCGNEIKMLTFTPEQEGHA